MPLLAVALLFAFEDPESARESLPGVVVEEVATGSAGEKAGLRPGDILLAWERSANPPANPEEAEGKIDSVFDWMWVEMEQAPRAAVTVRSERGRDKIVFELPIGNWGITVRARLDHQALERYAEGRAALSTGQLQEGIALWEGVATSAEAINDIWAACWMHLRAADVWAENRRWSEAQAAHEKARALAEGRSVFAQSVIWESIGSAFERQTRLDDAETAYQSAVALRDETSNQRLSLAHSLNALGRVVRRRGDVASAETYHKRALALQERQAPDGLAVAASLHNLGAVAHTRDELTAAEAFYRRALAIRERLAPDSLDVHASLNGLGGIAWSRGEFEMAEAYDKRALAIAEKLAPASLAVANSLISLGLVARGRGALAMAESNYKRALAIQEKLVPGSLDVSMSLNNLGMIAWLRGELAAAEEYHRRSLTIKEKAAPDSLDVADSLNNLGVVAYSRGELDAAEAYFRRTLTFREKLAPNSLAVATSLTNVGEVARDRGELTTSTVYHQRALAIREKRAPDSLAVASSINSLGSLSRRRGDLVRAEAYYERALTIAQRLAPDSLDVARYLHNLVRVAIDNGDVVAAEGRAKRALMIRETLAPGSVDEAESQHDLGLVYRQRKEMAVAANHMRRAIAALEAQVGKLGGAQETQAGFGAQYSEYYRDYIELLVESKKPAEAFHVLERSRARTLLAMLAERDLVFSADVPVDIERERKQIAWEYDRTQARLTQLNPLKEQANVDEALNRLRELRSRQSELAARIRRQSPRFSSLQYPQPLDVDAVRAALDRGTLLLSYSVHKDKTYLFEVTSDAEITVHTVSIGEAELRDEIGRFREVIKRAQLGATDLIGALERGRRLFEVLIQPVASRVERAQRVLLIPDGPLHTLPFAALVRRLETRARRDQRDWQYLVEWKPVHVVVSATVYGQLRREHEGHRAHKPKKTLIAFGDPRYEMATNARNDAEFDVQDAIVRSMLPRGHRLAQLPGTKNEVAAIAALYRDQADAYLGEAATEERAKSVAASARYLHFASHGLLDERFPLNSGLALTIRSEVKEGQDNGILQAWEIFERLRIDAELVVLSACETGLGKELGGEGLVGLMRAFQYAGARSVVASLWNVADETTAALMKRFYARLKAGESKDAALRHAQMDLIRDPGVIADQEERQRNVEASHPFYWAAFQLNGDWR